MRTELPKKWCVKAEDQVQAEIIYPFHNKVGRENGINCMWEPANKGHYSWYAIYDGLKYLHSSQYIDSGFELISFEEFQHLVLGKNSKEQVYEIY